MKRQERTRRFGIKKQIVLFISLATMIMACVNPTEIMAQEMVTQQSGQHAQVVYPAAYQVYPPEVITQWLYEANARIHQRTIELNAAGVGFPLLNAIREEEAREFATGTIVSNVAYTINEYGMILDAETGKTMIRDINGIYRSRQKSLQDFDPYANYPKFGEEGLLIK